MQRLLRALAGGAWAAWALQAAAAAEPPAGANPIAASNHLTAAPAPPRAEPPAPQAVTWTAPAKRPPTAAVLPTSDRPLVPCEPAPPPPPAPPPHRDEWATPKAQLTATPEPMLTAPQPLPTCRFADPPPPARDDGPVLLAVVRRDGGAVGAADTAVVRRAIEETCRTTARACQTEVTGDRQVRVLLTVQTERDWQMLFERLQALAELGNHGVVFQVRVRP
jgi:hypothetical protein